MSAAGRRMGLSAPCAGCNGEHIAPLYAYPESVRRVVNTTNAIEAIELQAASRRFEAKPNSPSWSAKGSSASDEAGLAHRIPDSPSCRKRMVPWLEQCASTRQVRCRVIPCRSSSQATAVDWPAPCPAPSWPVPLRARDSPTREWKQNVAVRGSQPSKWPLASRSSWRECRNVYGYR